MTPPPVQHALDRAGARLLGPAACSPLRCIHQSSFPLFLCDCSVADPWRVRGPDTARPEAGLQLQAGPASSSHGAPGDTGAVPPAGHQHVRHTTLPGTRVPVARPPAPPPAPAQLHIQYGQGGVDDFIRLADSLEDAFPRVLIEGDEVPWRGGWGIAHPARRAPACTHRAAYRRRPSRGGPPSLACSSLPGTVNGSLHRGGPPWRGPGVEGQPAAGRAAAGHEGAGSGPGRQVPVSSGSQDRRGAGPSTELGAAISFIDSVGVNVTISLLPEARCRLGACILRCVAREGRFRPCEQEARPARAAPTASTEGGPVRLGTHPPPARRRLGQYLKIPIAHSIHRCKNSLMTRLEPFPRRASHWYEPCSRISAAVPRARRRARAALGRSNASSGHRETPSTNSIEAWSFEQRMAENQSTYISSGREHAALTIFPTPRQYYHVPGCRHGPGPPES